SVGLVYDRALALLVLADYVLLGDSRGISVGRRPESTLSIGEWNSVRIDARHRGVRPVRVAVRDEPPTEFEVAPRQITFDLSADGAETGSYRVRPEERGDYVFGDLNARLSTFLGLLCRQVRVPSQMVVKVYPDVLQTKKHLLLARENRVSQMGLRRSRLLGQGTEFDRLRDYVPDDSPRQIDWKATARRGRLISREYDVEQSQNIMVLIDMGRSMASRTVETDGTLGITKADCAINAAVLLSHVAVQSDDRVGLFCFARGPVAYVPPGKGSAQTARLLDALYPLQPRMEEPIYYDNFTFISGKQQKRSLVFLFTDLVDPDASRKLIYSISLLKKHMVVCVALSDYELPEIIEAVPQRKRDLYTQSVALGIVRERRRALAQMAGQGVVVMDATPADLSVATVNKYLQLKREARI
ncbi:MAG: DUF58 domain-containing protein, partial [Armatimonadota bacterium]